MGLIKTIKRALYYIVRGVPVIQTYANIKCLTPSQKLKGKRILITGGGRGLGFSMAKKFVEEGADVVISGRNKNKLEESAKQIGCKYIVYDNNNIGGMSKLIDSVDGMLGGVNCLVNNAGISLHEESFLDVTEEQYDMQFDVNLKGGFFLTQNFIRKQIQNGEEGIKNVLFVSSETSMTVDERPYGLTKAALNSLVQGLACKFINKGFRINAIAPGITASEMTGFDPHGDLYLSANPTKRAYLPEEVAEIAAFLLCDASNTLNGQIIYTNEGRTINTRW